MKHYLGPRVDLARHGVGIMNELWWSCRTSMGPSHTVILMNPFLRMRRRKTMLDSVIKGART